MDNLEKPDGGSAAASQSLPPNATDQPDSRMPYATPHVPSLEIVKEVVSPPLATAQLLSPEPSESEAAWVSDDAAESSMTANDLDSRVANGQANGRAKNGKHLERMNGLGISSPLDPPPVSLTPIVHASSDSNRATTPDGRDAEWEVTPNRSVSRPGRTKSGQQPDVFDSAAKNWLEKTSDVFTTSPWADQHQKNMERRARAGSMGRFPNSSRAGDAKISPTLLSSSTYKTGAANGHPTRPVVPMRTLSTPPSIRRRSSSSKRRHLTAEQGGLHTQSLRKVNAEQVETPIPKPKHEDSEAVPKTMPPLSIPTYLQLELSSNRPSMQYMYKSYSRESPYESSAVTFERVLNFLLLPPQLERVLFFGTLACFDAWLYTFTILPLRFCRALGIVMQWWLSTAVNEVRELGHFVYWGIGRLWRRSRGISESRATSTVPTPSAKSFPRNEAGGIDDGPNLQAVNNKLAKLRRHRRKQSTPSTLLPNHKADILQGLLIVTSCIILTSFDASRMYHSIRGQSAIKLYVIYNVLEVADRLFSALGQDIFECLFSKETLDRDSRGRSKLLRPFGMFLLALTYNVSHATALFYQVITLNVAVNSYSNALLTLLLSNQFVEIKSTVFKKFEKENLFQLTCADVVERFQIWLMVFIIASRNLVELGINGMTEVGASVASKSSSFFPASFLPTSLTIFPIWTGQILTPFFFVLGSEMFVDWLKHAYISKFNLVRPSIYAKFYDVLAKDYYTDAFTDQNLTRRLGMPVIPLSCLFIRASMQTYHMFLATRISPHPPASFSSSSFPTTETTAAALHKFDVVFRRALGRSSFGGGDGSTEATSWDDAAAIAVMILVALCFFLILLALKLILGMCLLSVSRRRYKAMKERGTTGTAGEDNMPGKSKGGLAEVNEDKRKVIYKDYPAELESLKKKEALGKEKDSRDMNLSKVTRYTMSAKRIW